MTYSNIVLHKKGNKHYSILYTGIERKQAGQGTVASNGPETRYIKSPKNYDLSI